MPYFPKKVMCEKCRRPYFVRPSSDEFTFVERLRYSPCTHCGAQRAVPKPEPGQFVCKACHLPYRKKLHAAFGKCYACYLRDRRLSLKDEKSKL